MVHLYRRLASGASFRVIDHAAAFFFLQSIAVSPERWSIDGKWRVRKKRVTWTGAGSKIQFETVDRPASGVAHKFPRRSYNLLLNYSLSRGPPRHSLLSISLDIGMHASKIDAFAAATLAPIPRPKSLVTAFIHFTLLATRFATRKSTHLVPHHSAWNRYRSIVIGHHSIRKFDNVHFRFLPLYPKPVSLVTAFYPMNRRIWFNQGRVPKKWNS